VTDSWEEYQKLAHVYRIMGAPGLLSWADTALPHGLSYDSRPQMYNWFLRHLSGVTQPLAQEPETALEPDAKLSVTKNGSTMRSLGGETPFTLTRQRAALLKRSTTRVPLQQLLGIESVGRQSPNFLRRVPSQKGISIEALDIPSVAGVSLPAWLFRPAQENLNKPVLLLLDEGGRNVAWREDELCQELAGSGVTVCAADVRGIGDLAPEFSQGSPGYARSHQTEEDYAWSSLILGKCLLGQRVTDTLAIARALQLSPDFRGRKFALAAMGKMTVPALFAASLSPAMIAVYLSSGLSSYRNIIDTENYSHTLANFVPNILSHTDLPELVASLEPRRIVIAGAVDANNTSHSRAEVHRIYSEALKRGHLDLRNEAAWSSPALNEFCGSV